MKKIWNNLAKDLWIVLLDIIAVNLSYFLALMIRFYVNFEFRPTVTHYLTDFWSFTPFYTVAVIVIFACFRLYGGMWRYAGMNDMNRIILANLCTCAVQVVGTLLSVGRMPITYYVIGAMLQFVAVALIRFGYRIFLTERKKMALRSIPATPTMIIGAGETARKVVHRLEGTPFRATIIVDEKSAGKTLDGVNITGDFDAALPTVRAVFIADRDLSAEKREEIQKKCEAAGIELQDYTGYLSNLGGRIPVTGLLELSKGPVTLVKDGQEQTFPTGAEAIRSLRDRYDIQSIEGMRIELAKPSSAASMAYADYEAWAKQHKESTGEDVSFF